MYQEIARYYDTIHAQLTEDIPFILELAADVGSPILELGCGTGRVLRPLVANGFEVVGVDDSAEMLAFMNPHPLAPSPSGRGGKDEREVGQSTNLLHDFVGRSTTQHIQNSPLPEGEGPGVRVFQQNILTLNLPQKAFALAIFSHNTAHHFDAQQFEIVLGNVRDHLRTGGWLLLDLANPYLMERIEDQPEYMLENTFTDPETKQIVRQYSRWENDVAGQVLRVGWQYVPKGGALITTQTDYHYIAEAVLEELLVQHGFSEMMLFGNYDSTPFDEESPRMLVIAR